MTGIMTSPTQPLFVDVHVLQTVPPSNLNRDDAGSPKQATYGGARRARVSSQAWKRATRREFAAMLATEHLATRTKKISALLADRLAARTGLDEEKATRLSNSLLASLEIKPSQRKAQETSYLLFFGCSQLDRFVEEVAGRAVELAALDDKQLAEAAKAHSVRDHLGTGHPMEVALFGRMVADIPQLNVDAATQVAHALSTHPVEIEFDYFTAVDDENPKEETGAGMIGTVEFNSATLYRFATVGVHQLTDNLGGDLEATLQALKAFLLAFVRSMPTGHQNSFGHRTAPNLVAITLRTDQPVNLVSAFETPVRSTTGVVSESARRLAGELRSSTELWGLTPAYVAATYAGEATDPQVATQLEEVFGRALPFESAVSGVVDAVRERLASQGS